MSTFHPAMPRPSKSPSNQHHDRTPLRPAVRRLRERLRRFSAGAVRPRTGTSGVSRPLACGRSPNPQELRSGNSQVLAGPPKDRVQPASSGSPMRVKALAVTLRTMTEPGLRDLPVPVAVRRVAPFAEARIVVEPRCMNLRVRVWLLKGSLDPFCPCGLDRVADPAVPCSDPFEQQAPPEIGRASCRERV